MSLTSDVIIIYIKYRVLKLSEKWGVLNYYWYCYDKCVTLMYPELKAKYLLGIQNLINASSVVMKPKHINYILDLTPKFPSWNETLAVNTAEFQADSVFGLRLQSVKDLSVLWPRAK